MFHVEGTSDCYVNLTARAAPSPFGAWVRSTLRRLVAATATTTPIGDRVREAAELRRCATDMRHTDPRCADDLFAAADRHERTGA